MKKGKESGGGEGNISPRSWLNLNPANRGGLEKAIQRLAGNAGPKAPPADPEVVEAVRQTLLELGLKIEKVAKLEGRQELKVSSSQEPGRELNLRVPPSITLDSAPGFALNFAGKFFPEMEFFLPYILARSQYEAALRKTGRGLSPEPDYDDDGFLQLED